MTAFIAPQVLKTAIESEVTDFERRRCIGMAVTPQEKQLIELIRQDYYIAVGKDTILAYLRGGRWRVR